MKEKEFLNLVLQLAEQFTMGVNSGAQWEIYAQVVICGKIMSTFGVQGRELNYPGSKESVDIAFALQGIPYLIELKVESATNAGQFAGRALTTAMSDDMNKLKSFDMENAKRWMLCIAYSASSKEKLKELDRKKMLTALDEEAPFIAAIVNVDEIAWG